MERSFFYFEHVRWPLRLAVLWYTQNSSLGRQHVSYLFPHWRVCVSFFLRIPYSSASQAFSFSLSPLNCFLRSHSSLSKVHNHDCPTVLEVLATNTSFLNYAKAYCTNTDDHKFFICPALHGGCQDIVHIVFELAPLIPPAGHLTHVCVLECLVIVPLGLDVTDHSALWCDSWPGTSCVLPGLVLVRCSDQTFLDLVYFCRACHVHIEFVVICLVFRGRCLVVCPFGLP